MKTHTPSSVTGGAVPPSADLLDLATPDLATLELLLSWRREDATTDADQINAAERELAAFKRAMNENRVASAETLLFP